MSPSAPHPLGEDLVRASATQLGLIGIECRDSLIEPTQRAQHVEVGLQCHARVPMLELAQRRGGDAGTLGHLLSGQAQQTPPRDDVMTDPFGREQYLCWTRSTHTHHPKHTVTATVPSSIRDNRNAASG